MKRGAIATVVSLLLATASHAGSVLVAPTAGIATASPSATKAGLEVLRRGGNAMDAAVAAAFVLAVVHPQAGNLGGGGFLLYYDAKTQGMWALDFRETAPRAAKRDMFQLANGEISPGSRVGPRAGGVPGTVAGLAAAHERFGSRTWSDLLAPAAAVAREGFVVDTELERDLAAESKARKIEQFPATAAVFFPDGKPLTAGSRVVQTDLAATLERLAAGGAADFYRGETAKRIVDAIRTAGGIIGDRDLREYQPIWRAPLKIQFRDYDIYTMPPPSGGGIVLASALNILAGYDMAAAGFHTPLSIHLQAEASRRAFIDRNENVGDPTSSRVPLGQILSAQRAAAWRDTLDMKRATPTTALTARMNPVAEGTHTTHLTVADAAGNIVSLTTTLNENFGSGFVVPGSGFFLNNDMDDFSAVSGKPNAAGLIQGTPNAIEPGKRMASSMTPTIIFRKDKPFLALGTRGGPAIPTTILQVFLNIAIYGKSLPDAVAAPRFHHQALPERVEYERTLAPQPLVEALNAIGHGMEPRAAIGDVHAIAFGSGELTIVADPRRGGAAGGY